MESMPKLQQTWEVQPLLKVLLEELLPFAAVLTPKQLILPAEAGKAAIGPYPLPPKHAPERASGKSRQHAIASYEGHRHIEWAFGCAGTAEMALDGRLYLIQRGDLAIIPSDVLHLERIHDAETPYQLIWFCIYNQLIRIHAGTYGPDHRFATTSGATVLNCAGICRLFHEGTEEALKRPLAWQHQLHARVREALVQIARHIEKHGLHASHQHLFSMLELAKTHIESHYAEPLTLKGIAQLVYLSPNYFSSLFSQATGKTVIEYIQEVRMNEGCRLLGSSSIPVSEVSGLVGFHSANHFSRSFKQHTGKSPSEYRRLARPT